VFDVSIEGTKVLDNYDIFKKAGAFTATTETFNVTVADGNLNIDFSALVSDGGINRPKVSAIEILGAATTTYYRDATIATPSGTVNILDGTSYAATSNNQARVQYILTNPTETQKLNIKVFPNPSNSHFNVIIQSAVMKPITLKIIDIAGRTIQSFTHLTANTSILVGGSFRPGVYILEAIQGADRVMIKLVKHSK